MTPPPDRQRGDTYTVKGSGPEGDHLVVVMVCDRCDYLLPVAIGRPHEYACIIPGCEGRYIP